jgi:hypothetical protein
LIRAVIGRDGQELQEDDVAEQQKMSDSPENDDRDRLAGGVLGTEGEGQPRDTKPEPLEVRQIKEIRATDIEPYTGLRYLSKLFRFLAVILVVLLVAEAATGIYTQGAASIPTLLGEASRLIVLAGVLWGTGDLAHLLIDMGHDVRASRILVSRVAAKAKVSLLPSRTGSDRAEDRRVFDDRPSSASMADRDLSLRRNLADRSDSSDEGPPIP